MKTTHQDHLEKARKARLAKRHRHVLYRHIMPMLHAKLGAERRAEREASSASSPTEEVSEIQGSHGRLALRDLDRSLPYLARRETAEAEVADSISSGNDGWSQT